MAFKGHARRYAQAVFEIALAKREMDTWASDLENLAQLGKYTALVEIMENPKFSYETKIKMLFEPLAGISKLAMNLVQLLISVQKFGLLPHIADEYQHLYDDYRGVAKAEVITAVPLSKEDQTTISGILGKIFSKIIYIQAKVDPALIGGIVVRINGKIVDGSLISTLQSLKNELSGVSS